MEYLYLVTALWLVYVGIRVNKTTENVILLKLPAYILAGTFGILAAKGFGVI